jgi:hypothetical protein
MYTPLTQSPHPSPQVQTRHSSDHRRRHFLLHSPTLHPHTIYVSQVTHAFPPPPPQPPQPSHPHPPLFVLRRRHTGTAVALAGSTPFPSQPLTHIPPPPSPTSPPPLTPPVADPGTAVILWQTTLPFPLTPLLTSPYPPHPTRSHFTPAPLTCLTPPSPPPPTPQTQTPAQQWS